jgi:ATP-binding cassette subfamily F protein uup
MALISIKQLSLAYGHVALLDQADLHIDAGERVCLIGRNGAGKSSLMSIIAKQRDYDSGEVNYQSGVSIAQLQQDLPEKQRKTIYDVVAEGLGELGEIIKDYHSLSLNISAENPEKDLNRLSKLQDEIDSRDGWQFEQKIQQALTKLNLPEDLMLDELSGGWRRRVALASAIVGDPDILLLDEPTNHLDIESIEWLESFLKEFKCTILFITHDRFFLQKIATRIIELDRGKLTSWPGDYQNYLVKKAEWLENEARQNALFDKKLAQEETWIRQGIKARRTRNEGRVRALKKLREERADRRNRTGNVKFNIDESRKSGQLVAELENVSVKYDNKIIIDNLSTRIMRGDRIGVIGPNGAGKTTLLNLILGKLEPDTGTVKIGTQLGVAYFDQLREHLDPEKSVIDNVAEGRQEIDINNRKRHVISYLQDFLFAPERARSPVKSLSGGECNRLLLARIFSKPSNIMVLDEPTNDLDVETLELLEELLSNYKGTLLLVSHDRQFLDQVVTSCLVFEGNAEVNEYVGGYSDWIEHKNQKVKINSVIDFSKKSDKKQIAKSSKKISWNQQKELDELPALIDSLEKSIELLQQKINDADFYKKSKEQTQKVLDDLSVKEKKLDVAFDRWGELDAL